MIIGLKLEKDIMNNANLQILDPWLIMIVESNNFFKKLKKGYFKNSLTRIDYEKIFENYI